MSRTYGHARLLGTKTWELTVEPHVAMMVRRVFPGTAHQYKAFEIGHTLANAETLHWFTQRYPLRFEPQDWKYLKSAVRVAGSRRAECEAVLAGKAVSLPIDTLIPLREYQAVGVRILEQRSALLCMDDLGLGKTAVALGAIAAGMQPAVIVCQSHVQTQWKEEAEKFLRGVEVHVVRTKSPYALPRHNVLIVPYSKLAGWVDHLHGYAFLCFDEAQELRNAESAKYAAARALCDAVPVRLGLTATPIYNYGDEIFNVIDCIDRESLGTREEFLSTWCRWGGRHYRVEDPAALGSFLAEQHIVIRRRRRDLGRELPPVTRISHEVEYRESDLLEINHRALQLAQVILRGKFEEKGIASRQLDAMLRMQTGIAKAPFVAEFVAGMVETGEKVVLCGWHREVYAIWKHILEAKGIHVGFYTGEESPAQKDATKRAFVQGDTQVLILSNRSGAGLNDLQRVCSLIIFGELDWSPQVHEQCIGRLQRDEQAGPVTAIFLYASGGSDPIVAQVCGVKRGQSEGIVNLASVGDADALATTPEQDISRAAILARAILGDAEGIKRAA